jgi:hypothetical protein
MKFTAPFKGCADGDVYPRDFAVGDDCPEELFEAAREVGALSIVSGKAENKASRSGNDKA